jgi:hypothetical protein
LALENGLRPPVQVVPTGKTGFADSPPEDSATFDDPADAWVRQADGTMQTRPELADGLDGARGINKFGTIVGFSEAPDGWLKAVIWRPQ